MTLTYDLLHDDDPDLLEWAVQHTLDQLGIPCTLTREDRGDRITVRVEITSTIVHLGG